MNIKNTLLTWLACLIPQRSYSQDGEDLIIDRLLSGQPRGFYVDVGAHHPLRFSNTFAFYRRGWRGVNIDAMPGSMKMFRRFRKRDINIECGVAARSGTLTYHCFNEPALNTFNAEEAMMKARPPYHEIRTVEVAVEPLGLLLERYLPPNQPIDFLSVDVEGLDEEVLRSNDWQRFRPLYVLAEALRVDLLDLDQCSIVLYMQSVGYKPVAKAYNTVFFMRNDN